MKERRPKHNLGNLQAVWVAVERLRDRSRTGRRHSVKRACELLSDMLVDANIQSASDGKQTAGRVRSWSRLKALHDAAEGRAALEPAYRQRLDSSLSWSRNALWPDDELLPVALISGPELSFWLSFSDRPDQRV